MGHKVWPIVNSVSNSLILNLHIIIITVICSLLITVYHRRQAYRIRSIAFGCAWVWTGTNWPRSTDHGVVVVRKVVDVFRLNFSGCITFGTRKNDEVLGPHNPDYGHELIQIDGSRCWGWLRFFAADEISSWLLSGHYTRLTILDRDYRPHRQITGVEITPCHLRGIPFIECPPSLL